ncbi:MAG: T9SS type A sorting domain-containing protein [Flavobacteriaceae bacterium]
MKSIKLFKKFGLTLCFIFLTQFIYSHVTEIRVNQNQDGTLTWYLQTYHRVYQCGHSNAGLNINGVNYPINSEHAGSIVGLSPTIFAQNSWISSRSSYAIVNTPYIPGNLNVRPYSNNVCWAFLVGGNGSFTPPPPPVCTISPINTWTNTVGTANNNGTDCNPTDDTLLATITVNHQSCGSITNAGTFSIYLDPSGANTLLGNYAYATGITTNATFNLPYGFNPNTPIKVVDDSFGASDVTHTLSGLSGIFNGVPSTSVPTVLVQNINANLDVSGNVTITAASIDAGSSDACGPVTFALDKTTFNCSNIGVNTVTLTVTSPSGNTSSATAQVTVVDNIAPTVLTQPITVQLDATGNATITPQMVDNGSSDNCGAVTLALDAGQGHFTCANVGTTNTVTLAVTDSHGNTATGTANVTVQDVTPPTVVTQNITVQLDTTGNVTITPQQIDNGSNDSCGVASMALDAGQGHFTCANVGQANTVTLAVTDVNGNTAVGTANVTVVDVTAPMIVTQNVTVNLDATGAASISAQQFDGGSTDACGVASYALNIPRGGTINPRSLTCADVGTHNVTLIVTDIHGNAAQASATVTIQDVTAPTVVTQNVTVNLDANGSASVTAQQFDGGSTDACGVASYALTIPRGGTIDPNNLSCADIGTHAVKLIVTDVNGNAAQATAQVTVQDTTAPTMVTQPVTVQLDATGVASITTTMIDNGSSDNCSVALSLDVTSFSCANVGVNTVTLTGTDPSGNTATATAVVTVQDNIAPTVITQNITVQLDANGVATITPQQIDNGSSDNCSIAGIALDITSFNCENLGVNTVNLTVTDVNGNATTAPAVVTVQDTTAPTMTAQDVTVQLDANGAASITTAMIDNGSFDNCSVALSLDLTNFGCENVGTNTVTLTGTDPSGNVSTATAIVTVQDNIAPTVVTQAFTATITGGVATITAQDVDGGSFDNCGIQSMSVSPTTFVCGDQGNHTVTLTVTDNSGNVSTSPAIVTVVGFVPTIAIADFTAVPTQNTNTVYLGYGSQSMTLNTTTTGGSGFIYSWTASTGEIVASVANPTVTPLVSTTYTVTVTNANGCEATTSIDVCVIDARYINKEGEWDDGKVLMCKGSDDDDDDDDDHSDKDDEDRDSNTKAKKAKDVEKYLKKGYTLGTCNATCTTTYVEVIVDNDDDDHGDDDHADNDNDKDDDKGHNGDNDDDNHSDSNKTKVIIYPNPVEKEATITLKDAKKKEEGTVKVYDYKGRKIFSKKSKNLKKGVKVNMSGKKAGTYFVRIKYKGKVYTGTLLKER